MSLPIFSSITEVLDSIQAENPPNPFPNVTDDEIYEWVQFGDTDGGRLMPALNSRFFSPFLFRGQTMRYYPCLPVTFREKKNLQDRILLYKIKSSEFEIGLNSHPSLKFSKHLGLHLNIKAITQHYGIPTDQLDLTQNPRIAAFFATCTQNTNFDWIPIEDGIGVIYKLFYPELVTNPKYREIRNNTEMIGMQTLPRPGEQKAWSIKLKLDSDFETFPVKIYLFKQNLNKSIAILNEFNNGNKLFPPDVAFDLAQEILNSKSLSLSIAIRVLLDEGFKENEIDFKLQNLQDHFNIVIQDREPISLNDRQIRLAQENLLKVRDRFLGKIQVRLVRDIKKNK